jgi:hypothetical protein
MTKRRLVLSIEAETIKNLKKRAVDADRNLSDYFVQCSEYYEGYVSDKDREQKTSLGKRHTKEMKESIRAATQAHRRPKKKEN